MHYQTIILGGGIVGLSTAMQLQARNPNRKILLVEQAPVLASEQTGHNSGVIHAGIYYAADSFKARFCQAGNRQLVDFCRRRQLPYRQPGKLVVAADASELAALATLESNARAQGVAVQSLDARQLRDLEPAIRGVAALWVKSTGLVDFRQVAQAFADAFQATGGQLLTGARLQGLEESDRCVTVSTSAGRFTADFLVACCGMQADRVAHAMGVDTDFRILPVRGEYYQLSNCRSGSAWVQRPIYPVPQPGMPFLGVHFTPMANGAVTLGPNAVMGWHRQGYGRFNLNWRDSWETLSYPGFWRMAARHWRFGLRETADSLSKRRYLRRARVYCPQLRLPDLQPYPTGIRAQAVNRQGELLQDFWFGQTPRSLHVCNAPSPAATACLPIGAYLCDKLCGS